jgi:hypothetical protein
MPPCGRVCGLLWAIDMKTHARLAMAAPLVLLALEACSGRVEPATSMGRSRQADTAATPLYSVDYHAPGNAHVSPLAAEVDGDGNTVVLTFFLGCSDCPEDYYAFTFDNGGAFSSMFEVLSGPGAARDVRQMRLNDTGLVAGGHSTMNATRTQEVLIERFDPSHAHMFEAAFPGSLGSLDLCEDGSTVVLNVTSPGTVVTDLDTTGNVQWTTPLTGVTGSKVRCTGGGNILVAGLSGGMASAAQLESDGTLDWTWTGADPASFATFDVDDGGNMDVLSGAHVYSLASDGSLSWSVAATQSLGSICASDIVAVAGSTAAAGGGSEYYTGSYDASGSAIDSVGDAAMSGSASGVNLDDDDDAFVCGPSGAALFAQDGSTTWTYAGRVPAMRTDVTNGVARCIGASTTGGIGIVAFQVP